MTGNPRSDESASTAPWEIVLDGSPLSLERVAPVLGRRVRVEISDTVWGGVARSFEAVRRIAAGETAAYGINTGFGPMCTTRIAPEQVEALQENLILSHAVGVGPAAPPEIVRLMLLLKIHALGFGASGISPTAMRCLKSMLDHDVLPVVPTQGSLGASGDLAPLAHMVLPMIGRGEVIAQGTRIPAGEALSRFGIERIKLGAKEGLALINGTQFMAAYAVAAAARARQLLKQADLFATMSLEGLMGSIRPFDERLHRLRPHAGALETAENVRRLMADSAILASHAGCPRVQDPYSFRCVPQVHGASRDAVRHAIGVIETELNSVTDNPVILDGDQIISGGLFHGQPVALALEYLTVALAELASISERRTYHLIGAPFGLPALLIPNAGVNSGMLVAHYTAAALVSENKGLCMPACVDSIPTALDQEDHVSMGARSAVKALAVVENAETVLAIEQLCAAQALDFRAPLAPGVGPRIALAEVRRHITRAESDRAFGDDLATSLRLLRDGAVLGAVEAELGPLK